MSENYEKIKQIIGAFDVETVAEEVGEEIIIVSDMDSGIDHMIIDCEDDIAVLVQVVMSAPKDADSLTKLMQLSDKMIHGALMIEETGEKVIWKDTVRLADLDPDELTGPIQAFRAFTAEFLDDLIEIGSK